MDYSSSTYECNYIQKYTTQIGCNGVTSKIAIFKTKQPWLKILKNWQKTENLAEKYEFFTDILQIFSQEIDNSYMLQVSEKSRLKRCSTIYTSKRP